MLEDFSLNVFQNTRVIIAGGIKSGNEKSLNGVFELEFTLDKNSKLKAKKQDLPTLNRKHF